MSEDVRDKLYLTEKDVLGLNFIRPPGIYRYRRHYRSGLRSHIMQVLSPEAVKAERDGIITDGTRWFPRAEPLKMLRIFRTRFSSLTEAQEEVKRVKIIEDYLGPDNFARSEEFLVDYLRNGRRELILCGLQEYVKGMVLNPWRSLDENHLRSLWRQLRTDTIENSVMPIDQWTRQIREDVRGFIGRIKQMIVESNHIPDLAGVGNLILTPSGRIKLVDINNISTVRMDTTVHLDEKGYPVCDKSIEAITVLEQQLLGRSTQTDDPVFKIFLDPERMRRVKTLVREFYLSAHSTNAQEIPGRS
jgi:hypothetical protein